MGSKNLRAVLLATAACALVFGTGGGPRAQPAPLSMAEAYRFLNQATFGATEAEAARLIEIGVEDWIEEQIAQPASLQLPHLRSLPVPNRLPSLQNDRVYIWFRNAIVGPDQLRQRVAFALSQILVVSGFGDLRRMPYSLAGYYDVLAEHAFGDFRQLLEEVTLHPAMGVYLSMLGNPRPDRDDVVRRDHGRLDRVDADGRGR